MTAASELRDVAPVRTGDAVSVRKKEVDLVDLKPAVRKGGRWALPRPVRRVFGPLGVLVVWYVLSATGLLPADVLASPVDVLGKAWDMTVSGELPTAIAVSGERVVYGFVIGALIGTVFALIAGLFRVGEDLVDSTVGMLRTLPWVGLIPLFIIWFGIDEQPKIALVALGVTFPLYFNIYAGIRGVDAQLAEAGAVLGLSRTGLIRHVILPGALPSLFLGLRLAIGAAWLSLVVGEQTNTQNGIGFLMMEAREFSQTDIVVLGLFVYAGLGLLSDLLLRVVERRALTWRRGLRAS